MGSSAGHIGAYHCPPQPPEMGRRKSAAKAPAKKKGPKVSTIFDCPFCNSKSAVECNIDKKRMLGEVKCRICDAEYQLMTDYLTEPVDVFCAWIDHCEEINEDK